VYFGPIALQHSHSLFKNVPYIALMMKTVSPSEASVNIYHTTWHNIPESSPEMIRDKFELNQNKISFK
jgi:hypothetical protein